MAPSSAYAAAVDSSRRAETALVERTDWHGLIHDRTDDFDELHVAAIARLASASFASPFWALGSDGRSYSEL